MKINLFIVRHGHSPFVGSDDFKRPLSETGMRQTQAVGAYIAGNLLPGQIKVITSAAQRTLSSSENICLSLPQAQTDKHAELYSASVGDWCRFITSHAAENLILVGHNPTISQLHQYLTQSDNTGFSPATVSHLNLEIAPDGLKLPAQAFHIFCPKV